MENPERAHVLGPSLEYHVLAVPWFALWPLVTLPTSIASHQSKTGTRLEKNKIRILVFAVFCINSSRSEWFAPSASQNPTSALRVNRVKKCLNFLGWKAPEHINIKKPHRGIHFFPRRCVTSPTDANQSPDYVLRRQRVLPSSQSH